LRNSSWGNIRYPWNLFLNSKINLDCFNSSKVKKTKNNFLAIIPTQGYSVKDLAFFFSKLITFNGMPWSGPSWAFRPCPDTGNSPLLQFGLGTLVKAFCGFNPKKGLWEEDMANRAGLVHSGLGVVSNLSPKQ